MSLSKCLEQTAKSWKSWFEAANTRRGYPLLFANEAAGRCTCNRITSTWTQRLDLAQGQAKDKHNVMKAISCLEHIHSSQLRLNIIITWRYSKDRSLPQHDCVELVWGGTWEGRAASLSVSASDCRSVMMQHQWNSKWSTAGDKVMHFVMYKLLQWSWGVKTFFWQITSPIIHANQRASEPDNMTVEEKEIKSKFDVSTQI